MITPEPDHIALSATLACWLPSNDLIRTYALNLVTLPYLLDTVDRFQHPELFSGPCYGILELSRVTVLLTWLSSCSLRTLHALLEAFVIALLRNLLCCVTFHGCILCLVYFNCYSNIPEIDLVRTGCFTKGRGGSEPAVDTS